MESLRAIYSHGQLTLLDAVDLQEGQEIRLMILSDLELAKIALAPLLVPPTPFEPDDFDEDALMREIDEELRGVPPVSEVIIQERREGP